LTRKGSRRTPADPRHPGSGLAAYHAKRNFARTPEPRGGTPQTSGGSAFVVQKHAATRLHYDFRLAIGGVLKSWAVPRGPSLDPADKRLAMQTEDHPLEYGSFEGVIPQGEYGSGTVIVWDSGTWTPTGDPEAALRAGVLKFTLAGEKLRGGWALIRLRGRDRRDATGHTWLLVKERDTHARPASELSITDARPESVLSGRRLEAVAPTNRRTRTARPSAAKPRGQSLPTAPRR
jgi:bifunctional non-homologous end joining protein LigD